MLSASNDGYTRTIKTLASEVEELRESNRRLKHELESQLSFTHTFESSVSAIKAQVTSLSGALAQCQQSSKSVADVSSTVTANSAAITEIIRDNQVSVM